MIAITDTDESLELVTFVPGSGVEWTSTYAELTAAGLDLGSGQAVRATPGIDSIVAAPSSGARRQLKYLSAMNIDTTMPQTVLVQKRVGSSVYRVSPHVNLRPGEVLTYQDGKAWKAYDDRGRHKRKGKIAPMLDGFTGPHGFYAANGGGSTGLAPNGTIDFALCCFGRASRRISSVELRWELVVAAGTTTWAEAFVCRGEVTVSRSTGIFANEIMIEPRGFTDIAATMSSTGRKTTTINLALPIEAGDNVWVGVGGLFGTTAPTIRTSNTLTELMDIPLYFSSGSGGAFDRPSTSLGTTWPILGNNNDPFPWFGVRFP